ncbi:thioredoxin family protein [Lacihabitans sp. LS3-19]|uniref:thioredoxin family protein n=1 Tax=Lacihabitans sp. LS3-19 TaxID=2487335 RepID=UPI0020CE6C95|nr:thioredoxin family protein [Lacihabitans sp. LS3-19]MCP9767757.1 thioredoxin family protein [Lacihabitans sp. LS3-19]
MFHSFVLMLSLLFFGDYFHEITFQTKIELNTTLAVNAYKIGDEIKDFSLRNINGKLYSLKSFPSAKGFIIVFTSNYCPFSKSYEDRLIALDKKYTLQSYPVIAINPNDPEAFEEDNLENIQSRAKEKGFVFPILRDEKQETAKAFGAQRTPHVFVIKKEGQKYILKYSGAIDDNPQDASGITKNYLEDAVQSLLDNKPVIIEQTKPIGCAIRWK